MTRPSWLPTWLVDLVVVWAVAAPGWLPLLQGRLVGTHDGYFHLYRLFELDRAVRAGDLYPRWAPDFAFGYGYPVFNYYSPLMLYLAEPWRLIGAGLIASLGLAQVIAVFLAAAGMYLLARDLFGRAAGLAAALLYATLPYLLVDVYVRGAVAETLALALLPWVAWALHRVVAAPTLGRLAIGGLAVGALVLAHNITALTGLPVLGVLALLALRQSRRPVASLLHLAGAGALGLGLAALYWLPALLERDLVHNELLTTLFYDYHNQFQPLSELVQRTLAFSYRYDAFANFLFKPGLVQLVVAAVGGAVGLARLKRWRPELALLAVVAVGGLFLLTSRSAAVWEAFPLLAFVQFPWRMLSLVGFATALLAASAVAAVDGRRRAVVAAVVVLPWAVASFPDLHPALLDLREDEIGRGALNRIELDRKLIGTTTIGEYTPRTVTRDLFDGWRDPFPALANPVQPRSVEPLGDDGLRIAVDAASAGQLLLDQYAFPGWSATADGRELAMHALGDRGLLAIDVPAGAHEVVVRLGSTPVRTVGLALSAASLIVLGACGLARLPRRATVAAATAAAAALLPTLGQASATGAFAPPTPGASLASFEGGPRLLGGRDEGSGGLTLYWSTDAPQSRAFDVALRLLDDNGAVVARRDEPPRFGLRPTDAWRPGVVVRDAVNLAALPETPLTPGRSYRLVVGLHDDAGYLAPKEGQTARWTESCPCAAPGPEGVGVVVGEIAAPPAKATPAPFITASHELSLGTPPVAGGRIELTRVAVDVDRPAPTPLERLVSRLASRLPLLRAVAPSDADNSILGGPAGVLATLDPGGAFLVTPTWRSLADVPNDYAVFVHLLDNQQQLFAQDDEWPRRGFSPTSQWHTGQVTPDGYHVRIPADAGPGGFTVALGLYTRGDFKHLTWSGEPKDRDQIVLGRVKVRPMPPKSAPSVSGPRATFGAAIELEGFAGSLPAGTVKAGTTVTLQPRWRSAAPADHDYTTFVQLLDASGKLVASGDAQPLGGRYPTSLWEPGEQVDDAYQVAVPPSSSGPAKLIVGLYRLDTGERLKTETGADSLTVASFAVAP